MPRSFNVHFFALLLLIVITSTVTAQETPVTIQAYELFEVEFDLEVEDPLNPFRSADVQVDAVITSGADTYTVPCFFDSTRGWHLRFTPWKAGEYTYSITAKFQDRTEEAAQGQFTVEPSSHRGFLRVSEQSPRNFVFENGESYFPLGENLGWVSPPNESTWAGYLQECEEAGINWIRIWMCSWGMTELEWTPQSGRYRGAGNYEMRNARMWDSIYQEAERRGVYIVHVINHHGQYSSQTNPIWNENPYNTANGGYLSRPQDFFTNEQAKAHYRDRLRYLVARWGYSTHLMAWEFWNEVDLTSGYNSSIVRSWHKEMSDYLDGIDPYKHLRSTSASGNFGGNFITDGLDFLQSHNYISNLTGKVLEDAKYYAERYPNYPHFQGEMSYGWQGPTRDDRDGISLHNQLWASVHSHDSGTAMTWWWDNWVRPYNLYYHFKALSNYISGIDWVNERLEPVETVVEPMAGNLSDFVFLPAQGWGETSTQEFRISSNGSIDNGREIPSFIHGQYHRQMAPNPIFIMNLPQPSEFTVKILRVARAGARLVIRSNQQELLSEEFPATPQDRLLGDDGIFTVQLPAGENRVEVRNPGLDWFEMESYQISGFADRVLANARGNNDRTLVWVRDRSHQFAVIGDYAGKPPIEETSITLPHLTDGEYQVESFDTYTGEAGMPRILFADDNGLRFAVSPFEKDTAYRIRRQPAAVNLPLE